MNALSSGFGRVLGPNKRLLLAFLGGMVVTPVLSGLGRQIPGPNRLPETIAVFIAFVLTCLFLDRVPWQRFDRQSPVHSERHEAKRLGELRIGVPEGLVHLEALRKQGRLEQRLAPLGVNVVWKDYFSASALLQALDRGEIDFCGGGGTPSVFAQAADLLFTRIGRDKYTNPGGEAILVANDSPLQALSDLKGARVAVEEGSTAHYVLIRALAMAGLTPGDVEIIFLSRIEALAQFQAGSVQAWSVWVPYADSPRRKEYPGRSIARLQELFQNESTLQLPLLYYASTDFGRDYPEIMKIVLEEINEAGAQVNRENLFAVERLREELNFSDSWLERLRGLAAERAVVPLDHAAIKGLQLQADTLYDLQLISQRVRVSDGTYTLVLRQNGTR